MNKKNDHINKLIMKEGNDKKKDIYITMLIL